jgi:hypothetical protein
MLRSRFFLWTLALSVLIAMACAGPLAAADEAKTAAKQAGTDAAKPAAADAKAQKHAYAGLAKCKMCHMPYFKAWSATPHAKAFAALDSTKKQDQDPKCVKCHVTGFEKGGYALGKPATAGFKGVQCEACHGPGADYMKVMKDPVKAKAAGMITPTQEVCVGCHSKESPTFKGFDYAAYLAKGVHKVPKETKK